MLRKICISRLLGAILLAFALPAISRAQVSIENSAFAARVERELFSQLPNYKQSDRDGALYLYLDAIGKRAASDSVRRLLRTLKASPYVYSVLAGRAGFSKNVDSLVALGEFTGDPLATDVILTRALSLATDTTFVFQIADRIRDKSAAIMPLRNVSLRYGNDTATQHRLARRALGYAQQASTASRPIDRFVVTWLVEFGDMSGVDLAIPKTIDFSSAQDIANLVVDIGATLRAQDDPRADSVFAIARRLLDFGSRGIAGNYHEDYYWRRYIPALTDTNPMRFLPQLGRVRENFLQNVVRAHVRAGKTEVPLKISDELISIGDTALAAKILMDNSYSEVPFKTPPSLFESDAKKLLLTRAVAISDASSDTILKRTVRGYAHSVRGLAMPYTSDDSTIHLAQNAERQSAITHAYNLAATGFEIDAAKTLLALESDRPRDDALTFVSQLLANRRERALALQTATAISDSSRRDRALLVVMSLTATAEDSATVSSLAAAARSRLKAQNDPYLAQLLIQVAVRMGQREEILQWIESQPESVRATMLVTLLRYTLNAS